MTPSRRAVALGAVATAALAAAGPSVALALGGGGFSVSGKKGPFVKQVATRSLGQGAGGTGAMGLASDAVNSGQYQAARLRMPQTEAKVAALLAGIDAKWPYAKGQPLQVHILGVDYYNAYSLPDGSIVVAFGLLDQAQSDDEVAFVLAHELGHVRLGHFRTDSGRNRPPLASRLGQLFLVSSALEAAGGAGNAVQAAATRADATNDLLHFLGNVTAEPVHTPAQEDEADCVGFDLSQAASYAADSASARVFDSVQADQQKREALTDGLDAQLKHELGQAVTKGAAQTFLSGGMSSGGFGMGLLQGAGHIALSMAANASSNQAPQHRPPEERKRGVAQYSADAYPEGAPLREEQHGWLKAVRGTSEYAQAKIAVDAVNDAKTARSKGDYPTATAAIATAGATTFRAAPLVLNEAARLRDDMGDPTGADALFVRANASPDQTIDGYLDYGRMLFRTAQNDRALAVIQAATARFNNDPKPFLSLLIGVSRQAGREDDAARYLQQCMAYNDQALAKDCQLAAGGGQLPQHKSPFGLPHLPL
jgi:beta-barrel assembly-enhancing protease